MTKRAYQLFNPIEQVVRPLPLLNNVTQETAHPMVPAVYIQLQAEALFGVRLGAVRLSALLAQFYGYRIVGAAEHIERVDVRLAREEAETDEISTMKRWRAMDWSAPFVNPYPVTWSRYPNGCRR
ncbi:hypothetical protein [Vibrio jasicida]|uniref:hypothetical protein n=1 Tax=Vibrio jasicida TaxID=766224 RepID=UPI000CE333F7|nr:hypothetical protein [Vibrio jasicida]